jgi:hypothetical protein
MEPLVELASGNPGAITVIKLLLIRGIDGCKCINTLQTLNIKGPMIWMLYKDVCRQNLDKVISILSAYTNGKLTKEVLIHAINTYGDGLTMTDY